MPPTTSLRSSQQQQEQEQQDMLAVASASLLLLSSSPRGAAGQQQQPPRDTGPGCRSPAAAAAAAAVASLEPTRATTPRSAAMAPDAAASRLGHSRSQRQFDAGGGPRKVVAHGGPAGSFQAGPQAEGERAQRGAGRWASAAARGTQKLGSQSASASAAAAQRARSGGGRTSSKTAAAHSGHCPSAPGTCITSATTESSQLSADELDERLVSLR